MSILAILFCLTLWALVGVSSMFVARALENTVNDTIYEDIYLSSALGPVVTLVTLVSFLDKVFPDKYKHVFKQKGNK